MKKHFHPININAVKSGIEGMDISGKMVVVGESVFSKPPKDRRFIPNGGFGCFPNMRGTAVYGKLLHNNEETRVSRYDIEGIAEHGNEEVNGTTENS
jgi:hypothetical protein